MGAASVPLVNWLSLLSYRDVGAIVSGQGTIRTLDEIGISSGEGPLRVLATCLLGTTGTAAAAAGFTRAALARFDRTVGRPERPPEVWAKPHHPRASEEQPATSVTSPRLRKGSTEAANTSCGQAD